jgi:chaperonin cofactor prefoldin
MNNHKFSRLLLLAITLSLAIITISYAYAQNIQDSKICYGYGTSDLQPKGIGNTVFPYTEKVGLWVKIQNPAQASYRIIWKEPNGNQFRNQPVEIVRNTGTDWGIVFDSIYVAETTAGSKLGVWNVELYIDGELARASQFQIIDYESIQQQVSKVIADKNELEDLLDDIRAAKDALEEDYTTLENQYKQLQSQVGTQTEFEKLQDDYDDLNAEYASLKASQSSTKTMMYAAIVVALVAIVVAVYFGVLKK